MSCSFCLVLKVWIYQQVLAHAQLLPYIYSDITEHVKVLLNTYCITPETPRNPYMVFLGRQHTQVLALLQFAKALAGLYCTCCYHTSSVFTTLTSGTNKGIGWLNSLPFFSNQDYLQFIRHPDQAQSPFYLTQESSYTEMQSWVDRQVMIS